MTEAEWLASDDPEQMLTYLQGKETDRKLRLFACACCRPVWHLLTEERSKRAVEFAESAEDDPGHLNHGRSTHDAVREAAYEAAGDVARRSREERGGALHDSPLDPHYRLAWMHLKAANAATLVVSEQAMNAARMASDRAATADTLERHGYVTDQGQRAGYWLEVRRPQARLLRDIFGNPFRPVTTAPSWLTSTVVALARGIYADRAFDRLPILADALQDAGCDHPDLLAHCRDPQLTHVRGCWVVDLMLGLS